MTTEYPTLPTSEEAEHELLGSILIDPSIMDDIQVTSDHFFYPRNKLVFNAINDLYDRNDPIDAGTILEHLTEQKQLDNLGGPSHLLGLIDLNTTAAYWEVRQRTIIERWKQREIYQTMQRRMADAANLKPSEEILGEIETFVTRMDAGKTDDYQAAIMSAARYATGDALVKTGFNVLDNAFGGFTRNDFTVIGARTSTGKSAFIHAIADRIAQNEGAPVTIFTPDQPIPEVLALQAARECGIPLAKFRHGLATPDQKERYVTTVQGLQDGFLQRLDFRSGMLTLKHFERETIRAIRNGSIAIVVDTINRISGKQDKKHTLIAEFGSLAKSIAAEYDVPIIGLAQVRREMDWEERDPTRADLADAPGSLANDANMILLLNRGQEQKMNSVMQVIIDKAKADAAGRFINVPWDDSFATIRDMEVVP